MLFHVALPRVLLGRLRKSLLSINPVDRPCEPRQDENRVSDGSKGGKKIFKELCASQM